ncbi:MAG: DNA primase, partial [Alloprevotella sp.]|nr:DNA primase [Alloprevotella sp.]
MIDRQTIQRILDASDIVEVVKEFVTLRKAGVNYKGLCPFHNERTPSFVVSPSKQLCKCFSCGKGGDVVHFVMEHEHMSYPEALRWLAAKHGIAIEEREMDADERRAQSERASMLVLNEWACKFFERTLREDVDGVALGMAYLRSRGFRDDIIRKFRLGFSPESRDALAKAAAQAGFNPELLEKTGLCFRTERGELLDRFHGRVIFPVLSVSGATVAFGGRILGQNKNVGKYVNSPESLVYSKSRELYGLYQAKQAIVREDHCFLVEGYTDVMSMHQCGIENVVASSGTSLTDGQIRLLHRFTEHI